MEYRAEQSKVLREADWSTSDIDMSGVPHSLGSGLAISLICHALLVVGFTGYESSGGMPSAGPTVPVVARLQPARLTIPPQKAIPAPSAAIAEQMPPRSEGPSAQPGATNVGEVGQPALAPREQALPYIPVELLSSRPRFQIRPEELLPRDLAPEEKGRIVVQLLVDADGRIGDVVVERSELSQAATQRFARHLAAMQLDPGMLDGNPARARWRLEFTVQAEAARLAPQ